MKRVRVGCLLMLFLGALGLPGSAQPASITNPGGASLATFPATAPGWILDFNSMAWGDQATATLQVYGVKRYRECEAQPLTPSAAPSAIGCIIYNVRTDLFSSVVQVPPDVAVNSPIPIDQTQALSLGLTQQQLNNYLADPEPYISVQLYKAYVSTGTSATFQYTKHGNFVLMAEVPEAGPWQVTVMDSHFQTKSIAVTIPSPGIYGFQVNNVSNGNVRVSFLSYGRGSYYRQEPLVVRPAWTAGAGIKFVTQKEGPDRYIIKHLSVGQFSQDENGGISILAGKDAMVRVMLQDSKGEFILGQLPPEKLVRVQIEYGNAFMGMQVQDVNVIISAKPVETGAIPVSSQPAATIPGAAVAEGLYVRAKLLDQAGTVVHQREVRPTITQGRPLVIHPYSIRPIPQGTPGFDYITNEAEFRAKVARWAEERFPNSRFDVMPVQIRSGRSLRPPWQAPQPNDLIEGVLSLMNVLARQEGYTSSQQGHIFVGIIDDHYYAPGAAGGMAQYGRPGIAMHGYNFADGGAASGHIFTHELGHCFSLKHTPSVSSSGIVASDPDAAYPYSGNGLSAGYAFSSAYQYFNREITQNWDHMSYTGPYSNQMRYFSDYNFSYLSAQMAALPATQAPVSTTHVPDTDLPKQDEGTHILGRAEIQGMRDWMASNLHGSDVCRLDPGPVVGEQGQFLRRGQAGPQGSVLLPTFDTLGPISLTSPASPPVHVANPYTQGMACWFHCPHTPRRTHLNQPRLSVGPDAP